MKIYKANLKQQSGAVLAVSLIFLLVLTVLAVSNLQNVALQEKMTMAVRDGHISLEASEAGLKDAETVIENLTNVGAFNADGTGGNGGLYSLDNGPSDYFDSANWVAAKTDETNTNSLTVLYYIEDLGIMPEAEEDLSGINMLGYGQTTGGGDVNVFKVVSRSDGVSGNAERIVITYYGKRL